MWLALVTVALAIDVVVTEDPRRDRWEVEWAHDEPVRGFVFARNRNPVQEGWKAGKGRIEPRGDRLAWLAPKGARVTSFSVRFDTDTSWKAKDYELNVAFGDGARLLYTDHLFVLPLVCPEGGECTDAELVAGEGEVHHYEVHTTPGRFVLTPDGRTEAVGRWSQRGSGVYLYLGSGEPLPEERVNFLIDPTTPAWVADRSREWIGPLFDHFEAQTGRSLSFTPTILLSYQGGEPGQGYGGGGLPGQMQLQLTGQAFEASTPELERTYAHFLAHETFHMWNGEELSTDIDGSEEWLSEGSAELFASWATEELGVASDEEVRAEVISYATQCASQLRGPLLRAHRQGNYRAFYTCGAAALYQVHLSLEAQGGLPAVFRDVFADGDRYSTYDLLEVVHRRTRDPLTTAFLERLLRSGLGADPVSAWATALGEAGLATRVVDAWEADALDERGLHNALVQTVGDCDCGGSMSVWNHGDRLLFDALEQCDALGEGLEVTEVAGVAVSPRREALRQVWAAIDAGEGFELAGPDGRVTVSCAEGVARPRALEASAD